MSVLDDCKRIDKKLNCFNFIADGIENEDLLFSIKDCICVKGMPTTAGSNILKNYMPVFDATIVERIRKVGSIVGKTAQDEFGFGTFSKNTYKIPKNPWDSERSCGGSSGGAACLTAALNHNHIAIAESTGGSISCPAAFCGVVGLTPTYGVVSRYGLIDYANSLDKIGVMSRSVRGCAFGLTTIAGSDRKDPTSANSRQKDYTEYLTGNSLKIGIPKQLFKNIDERVAKSVWNAIMKLEGLGFVCEESGIELSKQALAAYYIIAMSEASTNLAKYCGLRYGMSSNPMKMGFNEYFSKIRTEGFGKEAKRRIILGTYARMAGYRDELYMKAMKVRTLVINEFKREFKKADVLLSPTMPMLSPKLSDVAEINPVQEYQSDILTVPINLAGMPHISMPTGTTDGLPVGMQLMADHFREDKIIQVSYVYENARGEMKYPMV